MDATRGRRVEYGVVLTYLARYVGQGVGEPGGDAGTGLILISVCVFSFSRSSALVL